MCAAQSRARFAMLGFTDKGMIEGDPKSALVQLARQTLPNYVIDRLEEESNHGIPDIVVTGYRLTSWWEVKLAKPERPSDLGFTSREIQHLKMRRLSSAGHAWYIIYDYTDEEEQQVRIVAPARLETWRQSGISTDGFNHLWVVRRIQELHERWGR